MCGLLTFGAGTASAAEPPDIAQLVAAMQQEGQNAAEKAAFTGGGYRASLARAAETAAQAAAAAPVSAPAQEDPGETGGDEEPSEPAPVTQHSIHDENGYYVHNGSAYNSITKDGLWVGGTDENTGFHVDSDGNVTSTGSITVNRTGGAGSVTIDASTGKITGVTAGDIRADSTDAVNGSQLYNAIKGAEGTTYAAGDSVAMTDGSTTGEDKTISVKAGNGIEAGADGVAVKVNGNNLTVNENGVSLSENLSGLTSVTATGAITAGSFSGTSASIGGIGISSGKITGLTTASITENTDAANKEYVDKAVADIDVPEYSAGNGIDITGETISAKAKENGNIVVDENGISLAADVKDLTSVTASGAITAGSFAAGNVKINENSGGTITGLTNTEWTGTATNGRAATEDQLASVQSQIKDYTAGDGISIDDDSDEISVAYGDGLTTDRQGNLLVNAGDGLGFNEDDNSLEVVTGDGLTISRNGEVTAAVGNGLDFDSDGKIVVEAASGGNLTVDSNGISLNKELRGLTGISTETLTASSGITVGGTQYISTSGLNAGNHVITGVSAGTISASSTEAVNGSQLFEIKQVSDLAVTYTDDDKTQVKLAGDGGTTITNVKNGALNEDSTEAVNGRQLYAVDKRVGDATWSTSNLLDDAKDLTNAAQILDSKMGDVNFTGANLITNEKNLTDAAMELDSQIGNLTMHSEQAYFSVGYKTTVTGFLDELSKAIGPMTYRDSGAHYISSHGNVNSALLALDENLYRVDTDFDGMMTTVGFRKEGDEFTTTIDWSDSSYGEGTTIVTAIKNLDDRVLTLEGKNPAGQSLSAFSKMSAANVNALSALSNMDTKTAETLASMSSEQVETLAAKAPAAAPAAPAPGDPAATSTRPGPDGESETGDTGDAYEVNQDLHVTGDTTLGGALTVDGAGTFKDGLTVNTKTEGGTALTVKGGASIEGTLNMNDNKITGVADGEISETSTDAVNGSQLWGVQQDIENNASAIASLGGQVTVWARARRLWRRSIRWIMTRK